MNNAVYRKLKAPTTFAVEGAFNESVNSLGGLPTWNKSISTSAKVQIPIPLRLRNGRGRLGVLGRKGPQNTEREDTVVGSASINVVDIPLPMPVAVWLCGVFFRLQENNMAMISNIYNHPSARGKKKKKKKAKDGFYWTDEWRQLRYKALITYGKKCQCCGATSGQSRLHVDHIKPRSKFPELALRLDNLQILCEECNLGKGAWDHTDHR